MAAGTRGRTDRTWRCAGVTALAVSLILSALFMALAAKSDGSSWLTWPGCVGLIPFFLAIRSFSPGLVFWLACLWGGGFHLMLTLSGSSALESSWTALALMTFLPAAFGYFARMAIAKVGCSTVILAIGWLMVEFSLQSAGVRFGLLGHTHMNSPLLSAIGSFGGYALVAFLLVLVNALLLSVTSELNFESACFQLPQQLTQQQGRFSILRSNCPELLVIWAVQARAPPR